MDLFRSLVCSIPESGRFDWGETYGPWSGPEDLKIRSSIINPPRVLGAESKPLMDLTKCLESLCETNVNGQTIFPTMFPTSPFRFTFSTDPVPYPLPVPETSTVGGSWRSTSSWTLERLRKTHPKNISNVMYSY